MEIYPLLQYRVVQKPRWLRWWLRGSDEDGVKIRNKSNVWVYVITTDAATGAVTNHCGLDAGDKDIFIGGGATQIEIAGCAAIVLDWDFRKNAELILLP